MTRSDSETAALIKRLAGYGPPPLIAAGAAAPSPPPWRPNRMATSSVALSELLITRESREGPAR
jgi:hypothetical protein